MFIDKVSMKYPLVTFFIVSYNQETFIADAIDGAFSQDYPNLEIIISDDNSQDRTWDIIQQKASQYRGKHKLILNRNEVNLGPREHFNKVLYKLSNGEIIVVAAGDDLSLPQRTKVAVQIMQKHPEISSLSFQSQIVDNTLKPIKLREPAEKLSKGQYSIITLEDYVMHDYLIFSGDSRVFRSSTIHAFPPLQYSYAEDIFLFVRSLYVGPIAYVREPLVLYRQHNDSIMGTSKVKPFDEEKFKDTTVRQLMMDLDYAINQGYIEKDLKDCVLDKIEWVTNVLKPISEKKKIKKSFLYRVLRVIKKILFANNKV